MNNWDILYDVARLFLFDQNFSLLKNFEEHFTQYNLRRQCNKMANNIDTEATWSGFKFWLPSSVGKLSNLSEASYKMRITIVIYFQDCWKY